MKYGKYIAFAMVVGFTLSCDKVVSNVNPNAQSESSDSIIIQNYREKLKADSLSAIKKQDSLRADSLVRVKTLDSLRADSVLTIQRQDSAKWMSYFYLPNGSPASGATIEYRLSGQEYNTDYLYDDLFGWDTLQEKLNIQGGH